MPPVVRIVCIFFSKKCIISSVDTDRHFLKIRLVPDQNTAKYKVRGRGGSVFLITMRVWESDKKPLFLKVFWEGRPTQPTQTNTTTDTQQKGEIRTLGPNPPANSSVSGPIGINV